MTPQEIYENFSSAHGTRDLDDAQAATRVEWELELERALLIRLQGELIREGWDGPASDAAAGAAAPLAKAAEEGADLLSRAEDLLDRQSGSFHRAANSVQPVSATPPELELGGPIDLLDDFEAKVNAYKASAQHNLDVYGGYDGASEYNETNMPSDYPLGEIPGSDSGVTIGDPKTSGSYIEVEDGPRPGGDDGAWRSGGDPSGGPVDGAYSGPPAGGPPPFGGSPVGGPGSAGTTPNDFVPAPVAPANQWGPSPQVGVGPSQPGLVAGVPFGGPGGPGASGGPRGPGGPTSGRGPVGAGPGAGVRGGAGSVEEAGRRAAASAGRGAGPGVMGAPATAGRKGEDDEEHRRKVLLETDGESVFGSDQLTAPQVIGDDEYEED